MRRLITLLTCSVLSGALAAADPDPHAPEWQISQPETRAATGLPRDLSPDPLFPIYEQNRRPRLSVALSGDLAGSAAPGPGSPFSWSLEAWQLNTASLAHIQCSRATRTVESFLAEDCRFVDQPPPSDAGSLVQVAGQWLAAPGLSIGAGAYSGQQRTSAGTTFSLFDSGLIPALAPVNDQIDGVNMNLSFGVHAGRIGDLLVDLQLARYRRQGTSFSELAGLDSLITPANRQYQTSGQLGLGWRKSDFTADVTRNYQELPYWLGREAGQSFSSFDLEFSWRAPSASFSIGVSNVLDRLPSVEAAGDAGFDEPVESIYGRIPYVRYKHDL